MNLLTYPTPQPLENVLAYTTLKAPETETDVLKLTYCPHLKLLCAQWLSKVPSSEIRHAIRMLARATAILQAEFVLMEMPIYLTMSDSDRRWANHFISEATQKSGIQRMARVIPASQNDMIGQVTNVLGTLPYCVEVFNQREEALQWLLRDKYSELKDKTIIRLPLNFNVKLIRSNMKVLTDIPVTAAPASKPLVEPAPIPDILSITTDFVTIRLDKAKSQLSIRWKKTPQSRQYRYGLLKAGRALIEHRMEHLLLNNQRMEVLTLADQGWLIAIAQKMLPATNLRKLAIVTSANALQQMSSERIGQKLQEVSQKLQTRYFMSEEDALEWLSQN